VAAANCARSLHECMACPLQFAVGMMITKMMSTILVGALLASTAACKSKGESDPAPAAKASDVPAGKPAAAAPGPAAAAPGPAAPAAAPAAPATPFGPHDPRFNVAIAIPAATKAFGVPNMSVEPGDPAIDAAAYKQSLTTDNTGTFVSTDKLADGWEVRYQADNLTQSEIHRILGGAALRCSTSGDSQAVIELGRASCLGMHADGATIAVPFAVPADDHVLVMVDKQGLSVEAAGADDATTADAETQHNKAGLEVLRTDAIAGGFGVAYQAFNGGIEKQGLMYIAKLRTPIGGAAMMCSNWGPAKSAADALETLDACHGLRGL
jgi:hypothetical protein